MSREAAALGLTEHQLRFSGETLMPGGGYYLSPSSEAPREVFVGLATGDGDGGCEVGVSDSIFESRGFLLGLAVAINHYLSRLSCYMLLF